VAVITSGHCALHYRMRAPAVAEAAARQFRRPRSSLRARDSAWGTSDRYPEGGPPQPGTVPHPPHSQPHHQQRKKQAGPTRRECLHATGSGAGDITTTPASSPPPLVTAPAVILTERYRCVHLEAGRRVPSDRPEEPPIVRICLITGRWRSRFLVSQSAGSAQGSLAGERRPRAQLTLSREAPFLPGEEASARRSRLARHEISGSA
jgi:hypothetical protein